MTVTGPKPAHALGFCQCHEHLMISSGISAVLNPALCIDDLQKSTAEVRQFKQLGGAAIIDAQPGGCNRMETALWEISRTTDVTIIASTGFHKLIFYPEQHWIFSQSERNLRNFFIHELEVGMYNNIDRHFFKSYVPIKAGIIKTALDICGLTPVYKKCFQAAADAAIACDVPLMVHIEQGADYECLLHLLINRGVKPERIIFCHMDRTIMPYDCYRIPLELGIALEFDTIGRFKYHSDTAEAALFAELIDRGFEDQLLFSLDTTRERLQTYTAAGVGLSYILTVFLPLLKSFGVTSAQLQKISHYNPARIFGNN